MNNEFTPMAIGLPDTKKERQIIDVYSNMCDLGTCMAMNLQYYFDSPHFEIKEMFDFLKSKDPKVWLYSKFIEYHGLTFPGMDLNKVIKLELVCIPDDYLQDTMSLHEQIISSISKAIELKFYFPLIKLFKDSEDEDCRDFGISQQYPDGGVSSPEFDIALYNHIRNFTKSEIENEVLKVIENAVNVLNELIQFGIIRNDRQRWGVDLDNFIRTIVFNLNSERPLSIHPHLAKFTGFGKYFEKSRIQVTGR